MAIDSTLGGPQAEGYLQASEVIAYANKHIDRYSTVVTANQTTVIEPAIRRASAWVDGLGMDPANKKSHVWPGQRKTGTQRRIWPRVNATYVDGIAISSELVPYEILDATAEAACWEVVNPNTLHGSITLSEVVKSEGIGPLRETTMGATKIEDARACLTLVKDYLASVLQMPNDGVNFLFATGTKENVSYSTGN